MSMFSWMGIGKNTGGILLKKALLVSIVALSVVRKMVAKRTTPPVISERQFLQNSWREVANCHKPCAAPNKPGFLGMRHTWSIISWADSHCECSNSDRALFCADQMATKLHQTTTSGLGLRSNHRNICKYMAYFFLLVRWCYMMWVLFFLAG